MSATRLTVVATTDVHGHVTGFDHVADAPFADYGHAFGMSRVATIVQRIRASQPENSVVVVDCGDSLVGSPLVDLEGLVPGEPHPMAMAFNQVGYDAATIGNHDLDHGLEALHDFHRQLDHPLLAANLRDVAGQPILGASTLLNREIDGQPVRVGIVGVTTPGAAVWNARHLAGRAVLADMVEAAAEQVADLRRRGADVVVILAHSGLAGTSYRRGDGPPENAGDQLAMIPGVDVVVLGHSHQHQPGQLRQGHGGRPVMVVQPRYWGSSVVEVSVDLTVDDGALQVSRMASTAHVAHGEPEDSVLVAAVAEVHERTRARLARQLGDCPRHVDCTTAHWQPNPLLGMVALAQRDRARDLVGACVDPESPILSVVSPLSRTAAFQAGPVRVRDLRALYPYPNRLQVVELSGAQVRDYLECSARYFADVEPGERFDPATMTSAVRDGTPLWDFLHDQIAGLRYVVDLARPVGSRVAQCAHLDGRDVRDSDRFLVAVDNYRGAGGGGYPHVATADVVAVDDRLIVDVVADWLLAQDPWEIDEWNVITFTLEVAGALI